MADELLALADGLEQAADADKLELLGEMTRASRRFHEACAAVGADPRRLAADFKTARL